MSFLGNLGEELLARRERMRASFGDRNGTLAEFILFAGVVAGGFAAVLGKTAGAIVPLGAIVGYVLLDFSRQRALAAGADPDATHKRHDRLAFILIAALAAIGIGFLVVAMQPPPHKFEPPPAGVPLSVDISPS